MSALVASALAISENWEHDLRLADLLVEPLSSLHPGDAVDVVAIGKAAVEMANAAFEQLGARLRRTLVIADQAATAAGPNDRVVLVGEHPRPGTKSRRAGAELLRFLDDAPPDGTTVFLLSGGASSLCVVPQPALLISDPSEIFDAALRHGCDITVLNTVRAAVSAIAGGLVLRRVRTPRSSSLILVDNVISGAPWVASGLTYDVDLAESDVRAALAAMELDGTPVGERALLAAAHGAEARRQRPLTDHHNVVVAEPSTMLAAAAGVARERGFRVISLGGVIHGDVEDVVQEYLAALRAADASGPVCVLGAGEVTVTVRGGGLGGRCQEFACVMVEKLRQWPTDVAVVARASDGRDFLEGTAGAWVDRGTWARGRSRGVAWEDALARHDSHTALGAIHQLLPGHHTGWNLCDLYVACASAGE